MNIFTERSAKPLIDGTNASRYLAYIDEDASELVDLDGNTVKIPGLDGIFQDVYWNCILDGIVIKIGKKAYYNVIDVLYVADKDITGCSLEERNGFLECAVKKGGRILV